jgi:hypothetical protein
MVGAIEPGDSRLALSQRVRYYSEGHNRTRGDLMQLAATLNNPLKRSPGAYARAFLLSPLSGADYFETRFRLRLPDSATQQ